MDHDESILLYRWIQNRFRADLPEALKAIDAMGSDMAPLVRGGGQVLDLCCGAGPWAFFFEDRGAAVTGIDFAPYMIELAHQEAERRGSHVDFLEADVRSHDLGEARFDLAVLMGNTVADLSPKDFSGLVRNVHRALKRHGRFAVQYLDGVAYFDRDRSGREGVEQEAPSRITWRYQEYQPDKGAWVVAYTNESTGERFDYTTYLYPTPWLRLLLEPLFTLGHSTRVGEAAFLDIFTKPDRRSVT